MLIIHDIENWDEATMHRFIWSISIMKLQAVIGGEVLVLVHLLPIVAKYTNTPPPPFRAQMLHVANTRHTWESFPKGCTLDGWNQLSSAQRFTYHRGGENA
ncbi:uncharacterized protein CcaverHIS019_0209280 [Cutaneotrichosporon cavernicola]|uniref:Uncharacterized protein n=1 Tax=Cutaneotrichosporon cavernicola TaxID=279322 RepID=A0AA48IE84_9TREE|nr:uncharacterized protein CcaverHIS019_0209280 [Cutaneotrichosporon cavernicola]BEI89566.1 hypothetical protein CcaverHIS019_0209280 [Cutaneotrichosporon cavernicola]BEJ05114.1 hypothetical protein CcaverHIS641_0209310 [Cutaneotrichosporon cavernicola]